MHTARPAQAAACPTRAPPPRQTHTVMKQRCAPCRPTHSTVHTRTDALSLTAACSNGRCSSQHAAATRPGKAGATRKSQLTTPLLPITVRRNTLLQLQLQLLHSPCCCARSCYCVLLPAPFKAGACRRTSAWQRVRCCACATSPRAPWPCLLQRPMQYVLQLPQRAAADAAAAAAAAAATAAPAPDCCCSRCSAASAIGSPQLGCHRRRRTRPLTATDDARCVQIQKRLPRPFFSLRLRWKAMPRMPSGSSTKPSFLYSPTTCAGRQCMLATQRNAHVGTQHRAGVKNCAGVWAWHEGRSCPCCSGCQRHAAASLVQLNAQGPCGDDRVARRLTCGSAYSVMVPMPSCTSW